MTEELAKEMKHLQAFRHAVLKEVDPRGVLTGRSKMVLPTEIELRIGGAGRGHKTHSCCSSTILFLLISK